MALDLKDRHVVVTGAGGSLGLALVRRLLDAGATCHLPVRREKEPSPFAGLDRERLRIVEGIDLSDEAAVARFYAGVPTLWASVHCAGGFQAAPLAETSLADLRALLDGNLASAFLCCQQAVRRMRASGASATGGGGSGGRLLNVAARLGLEPRSAAGMAAYAASKAALAALTVALAEELAPEGILVNAIAPSTLDTPKNRAAMPDAKAGTSVHAVAAVLGALLDPEITVVKGSIIPV